MAKKKLQIMADELNAEFRNDLPVAFLGRYGIEIETAYNLFAGKLQTNRVDGEDFTPEQKLFIEAFEYGYLKAVMRVRAAI